MINILKKLDTIAGWTLIVVLFLAAAIIGNKQHVSIDTFFYLGAGQYIFGHGIPKVEVFTCSMAGRPWVDHEWLYQLVLYLTTRLFGYNSIIGFQAIIIQMLVGGLFIWGYRKDRQLAIVFFLFCSLLVLETRSMIRAEYVSLLFLEIYTILIISQLKKRWILPVLVVLQIAWVNMHGFFILGLALIGLAFLAEYLKRHARLPFAWNSTGRSTEEEYQRLKQITIATILACLVNPYFIVGAWYPFQIVLASTRESKFFFDYIAELKQPIEIGSLLIQTKFPSYKILFILSSVSFILNRQKIDIRILFFWLFFAGFSLIAIRNLPFFVCFAYLAFLTNTADLQLEQMVLPDSTKEEWKISLKILLKIALVFWIGAYSYQASKAQYYDFATRQYQSALGRIKETEYPQKATQFLIQNKIQGNFFNDLSCGSYMIYRTYPKIKIFIDGRTEVFGADFFQMYQKMYSQGDLNLFNQEVEKLDITGVILNAMRKSAISEKFLQQLYQQKEWKLVYFDDDGVIFLKDVEANKILINHFLVNLRTWQTQPFDLNNSDQPKNAAIPYYRRAQILNQLGFNKQALAELNQALQIDPAYTQAQTLYKKINID